MEEKTWSGVGRFSFMSTNANYQQTCKQSSIKVQKATLRVVGAVSTLTAALAALQKYLGRLAQLTVPYQFSILFEFSRWRAINLTHRILILQDRISNKSNNIEEGE